MVSIIEGATGTLLSAARILAAGALAVSAAAAPAFAEASLTISIADRPGAEVTLDETALLALPQVSFVTTTIWTDGQSEFSGPSLASVLQAAGAPDGALRLVAANDYSIEMPARLVGAEAPIVALRIDGAPFSVRDKGPLWLVFPYDSDDSYRTETVYAYSVWQLTGVVVASD